MINSALKSLVLAPIASIALASLFAGAATSATAATYPQMKVSYDGLDLSSSKGVAAFDKRIESAARSTCANTYTEIGTSVRELRLCKKDLVAMAQAARMTAIAQATGRPQQLAAK